MPKGKKRDITDGQRYEEHRTKSGIRTRTISAAGREIGPPPEVADPGRRQLCVQDLRKFCETYFAARFTLAWSADHIKVIERIQKSILTGGLFTLAMPRGSGKTTICEVAAIWAVANGHRKFVLLVGASEPHAEEMLDSIKIEIETNDLLCEDYPEMCWPIRLIEGIPARTKGQTCNEVRTRISWVGKQAVLPTIEGSLCSGSIIRVTGITGRIRGMKHTTAIGTPLRPDFVIVDDPQTDESARSISQCNQRETVLTGAVLGLAGPGTKISAVMPCTVIIPGDLADRMLDRKRHPEWHGERAKLMYSLPANEQLWDEYYQIRSDSMQAGGSGEQATHFYLQNREEMDAGAIPAWPIRYLPDEVSAIQHAMNLKLSNPRSFASEYQNEPIIDKVADGLPELEVGKICQNRSYLPRGVIPEACTRLTAMIDVQGKILFWLAVAWDERFGGTVVDYGAWPEQNRAWYTAIDARPSLDEIYPGRAHEARIYEGLQELYGRLVTRQFPVERGGPPMLIEKCLVDANWGPMTDVVYESIRKSEHREKLLASHGKFYGAGTMPMNEWKPVPGSRVGRGWRVPPPSNGKNRHVLYDANQWKTFIAERLLSSPGMPGCLHFFGDSKQDHQLISDHLTAEFRVLTYGRGRSVEEWKSKPGRPENHWFDCLVGCAVAVSTLGLQGAATIVAPKQTPVAKKRVSFSDLYRQKNNR